MSKKNNLVPFTKDKNTDAATWLNTMMQKLMDDYYNQKMSEKELTDRHLDIMRTAELFFLQEN